LLPPRAGAYFMRMPLSVSVIRAAARCSARLRRRYADARRCADKERRMLPRERCDDSPPAPYADDSVSFRR
jgi:hypothetical protein